MRNIIIYTLLLLVISCDEDSNVEDSIYNGENVFSSFLSGNSLTYNGFIINDESQYSSSFASQVTQAIFYKSSNKDSTYDVGNLSLDGQLFTKDINKQYNNSFEFDRGEYLTLNISGNPNDSIPAASDSIYFPENIKISNLSPYDSVNLSGFTINWNPDYNSNKDVILRIVYSESETDHTFPSNTFSNNYYASKLIETDDDGSYLISSSDLSDFDPKCIINVDIYRGNYEVFDLYSGYEYLFLTYSYDMYYLKLYN